MKKFFFLFCTGVFFISCDSNESGKPEIEVDTVTSQTPTTAEGSRLAGCYLMVQQKDTATMNLIVDGHRISGKLQYRRFEKDGNDGIIAGVVQDSLIIGNYVFQSEGRSSVREVIFSIKGDSLFEGYGEIEVKGDTSKFKNIHELKFMPAPFIKVDCAVQ